MRESRIKSYLLLGAVTFTFIASTGIAGIVGGLLAKDSEMLMVGVLLTTACLSSSLSISAIYHLKPRGLGWLLLFQYALFSGFAFYTGSCYLAWIFEFQLPMLAFKTGKIAETYYVPPLSIILALAAYLPLQHIAKMRIATEELRKLNGR